MTYAPRWMKVVRMAAMAVVMLGTTTIVTAGGAHANDLPLAAASPLTGVAFDDKPLLLPVQRNFQMAMLTAGSELGRSCGRMEAYGWRMSQSEQGRVNQIFNNTVERLRLLGYAIQPQTLTSVSNDITLFTADRSDRHFIFLWSAGELGLVMNLCETAAPTVSTYRPTTSLAPSVQTFPVPQDVVSSRLDASGRLPTKATGDNFTPLGEWVGSYTCDQGFTGTTLQINHLRGKDFEGIFKFYPTVKNRNIATGSYYIYGQYDNASHRILINPGKWINHPANYYNTVVVGSFDPLKDSFSAYFQGISGCTSLEAKRSGAPFVDTTVKKTHKKKPVIKKKKAIKKAAPPAASIDAPVLTLPAPPAPAPTTTAPVSVPTLAPSPAPTATAPVSPTPGPTSSIDKYQDGITLSAPTRR